MAKKDIMSTDTETPSVAAFPTGGTKQEVGSVAFDGSVSPQEALEALKSSPIPTLPEPVEVPPVKATQRVSLEDYLVRLGGQQGMRQVHQRSVFEQHIINLHKAGQAEVFGTVDYFEALRLEWLKTPTIG